jgi:hypothetical protein
VVGKPRLRIGTANSDDCQSKLRQVDPNGTRLRLDEVHLVELHLDQQAGQVWWNSVASFPLAELLATLQDHTSGSVVELCVTRPGFTPCTRRKANAPVGVGCPATAPPSPLP